MKRTASVPGKIILSGDHAVVYGYPGIAVPSVFHVTASFEEDPLHDDIRIVSDAALSNTQWIAFIKTVAEKCRGKKKMHGTLTISSTIPIGKGMGSSTAIIIAITRALVDQPDEHFVRCIEDFMTPNNSGIDFAVIWNNHAMKIQNRECSPINLPSDLLKSAVLIDTGTPQETTAELVAWVQLQKEKHQQFLAIIGHCTEEILAGKSLTEVIPIHHRAQVALGVVPKEVQELIKQIESIGGVAKVIGAGAKTGGGGMVLAIHEDRSSLERVLDGRYSLLSL